MALSTGSSLGSYHIIALLGAGGMGEVYRARDTKLNRDVAIKVLPDLVVRDPDRLARFEREAHLLASLNHPNIAGIYGLEDSTGVPALVLELVEGPTLADTLAAAGARPSMDDALEIARQIAVGLEAAHGKGIIHRDLKPANVKRTPDGTVKILDFGLAKALDEDPAASPNISRSPTVTVAGTRGGVILGTAAYMSPEQARGQPLDERTDIWAFGCMLFELLTGRGAFGAPTASDVLVRVLSADPEWPALPAATPPAVRRLLRRCLEKDRKRRLHSIADARIEIEDARNTDSESVVPPPTPRQRWQWAGWAAAAIATAAAVALGVRGAARPTEGDSLPDATPEAVTADAGLTMTPAISADGRLVAYASDRAGRGDLDIWVQQSAGGTPLRLTDDPADELAPDFSPDGSQIVFRSERDGGGVYSVSSLGGEPRLLAREGRRPRFSPDGARVAYWVGLARGGPVALSQTFVVALAGGTPLRLLPDFAISHNPIWSPEGQAVLVSAKRGIEQARDDLDWWVARLDGSEAVKTGAARLPAVRASFSAEAPPGYHWRSTDILFSDGGGLWSLPMSADGRITGAARRLTLGVNRLHDPFASRDGRIVFAASNVTRVVERVWLANQNAAGAPQRLYTDNRLGEGRSSQTGDGLTLVVPRDREIWTKDLRTGKERFVLRVESRVGINTTISPDGTRIAYNAGTAGYVVEAAGGVARKVCDGCLPHGFLSDSARLLLEPAPGGEGPLWIIDTATNRRQDVVAPVSGAQLDRPHPSPDDRWLAFRRQIDNQGKTFVAPIVPGRPSPPDTWMQVDEPTVSGRPAGWSADSRILYLVLDTDGFRCLWGQHIDAAGQLVGKPYAVRHFHSANESNFGTSFGNAIAAGGFFYESTRRNGNIWMLAAPDGGKR